MRIGTCALLAVLAGCGTEATPGPGGAGAGTLVYAERDTQDIHILDLATNDDRLIDSGEHASVTIAPDGLHVAYAGIDRLVKVADRAGTITPILPGGGGCAGSADWVSSRALVYCISSSMYQGTMLVPALGTTPRSFPYRPSVSPDGTLVAYVTLFGDLKVESIDGSNSRVLVPSTDPTRMYPAIVAGAFTPDQSAVLVADNADYPAGLDIVSIADGSTIHVDDVHGSSTPFGAVAILGASTFSPDGSEIVLQSTTGLVAVSLATGAKRVLATFPERVSSGGAAFLPDGRVLWVRTEDDSVSDIGMFTVSLHLAGPGPDEDHVVSGGLGTNQVWSSIGVLPDGVLAVPQAESLLVDLDGTVLSDNSNLTTDILGVSPDGAGVIALAADGTVQLVGNDGTARALANAGVAGDLLAPIAAYSPH